MVATNRIDILDVELRMNPGLEILPMDRLSAGDGAGSSARSGDPDLYGVIRDRSGATPPHAVSCDTALLLLSLIAPARLPAFARRKLGEEARPTVERMVLDGLLEVSCHGSFVSGAPAATALHLAAGQGSSGDTAAQRLSLEAIHHGHDLGLRDPRSLSLKLYRYHREPLSPDLARRLGRERAVLDHLGVGADLGDEWAPATAKPSRSWRAFSARRRRARIDHGAAVVHKLYVSPKLAALPAVFGDVVRLFSECGVEHFKVARDVAGLVRPDKIVAYFAGFDDLAAAAERVRAALAGCPSQGVPFTSPIDESGLLSWGLDPPLSSAWAARQSWRFWVTRRLAAALVTAADLPRSAAVDLAVSRLALDGFDTNTWVPSPRLWRSR